MDGLRGREKSIDSASRTTFSETARSVAPKASDQGEISINDKTDWTSLLKGGRLAVGDPKHVPGIYAKEAPQKLGAWDTLSPELAPADAACAALAWLNAAKPRWGSSTAPMRLPARRKVVGTFPKIPIRRWNIRWLSSTGITVRRSARFMTIKREAHL